MTAEGLFEIYDAHNPAWAFLSLIQNSYIEATKGKNMPGRGVSTYPRGYVRTPADAPGFWQLGNLWRIMASGYQTGNSLCLIDQLVTPDGGGPCTHMHPTDEGLCVVSGHCSFFAGGENLSASAGSLVFVPRFTERAFSVDEAGTQLLNFYLPSGFEMFLIGFAHPAERNELPPKDGVPMAPPRLVEQLSRDFGQIGAERVNSFETSGRYAA